MSGVEISVVCAVSKTTNLLSKVHAEFREVLARTGRSAEFLYVLDGPQERAEQEILNLKERLFPVRIIRMARGFGPATALDTGFEKARGKYVLTIPDRPQIDAGVVERILDLLDRGQPMVVTRRDPRCDALLNRLQSRLFHAFVRRLARADFRDMTCDLRGMTRAVATKLRLYGDQHRFVPLLGLAAGFDVVEIPGAQHPDNRPLRLRGPGVYVRRLLDILNVYFLMRFTRKPLRFFGLIGVAVGLPGAVICAVLAFQRLVIPTPIRERPLLLLGVVLIVLGVQLASLGLLGEIVIFMSSRRDGPETVEIELDEKEIPEKLVSR